MFLGIDLGTSSVKVILIDAEQNIIASHAESLSVQRPQPLWSEQNPEDWWQATEKSLAALGQKFPNEFKACQATGLSGQMHGATLLDKNNQVLRPAILWNDGRCQAECEELMQTVPDALAITGNLIMPGFTAPKLLWVKKHEPELFKQVTKVLLPKDYLRLKLSGDFATDVSDASGTSWLNVKERTWSTTMLAANDLSLEHMPTLYEGTEITGTLLPALSKKFGLNPNCCLVAGGGDNAASAISIDVVEPGSGFLSLGTSGTLFVADNNYRSNPEETLHSFCHCIPNTWHHMSVHLSAANCIDWLAKLVNLSIPDLLATFPQANPGHTPIFLPYLSGERTPHNNPHARGAFFNLDHDCNTGNLLQAVLEGVAFAFADGKQVMTNAGVTIKNITLVGGGSRIKAWGPILASALNQPLQYCEAGEVGGAYGAARLAWYAVHGGDINDAFAKPVISQVVEPQIELVERYQQQQERFRSLYQVSKSLLS